MTQGGPRYREGTMPVKSIVAWTLLALLGLALAAGVTLAASELSSQKIGLQSEPLDAGRDLAPPERRRSGSDPGTGTTTQPSADPDPAGEDDSSTAPSASGGASSGGASSGSSSGGSSAGGDTSTSSGGSGADGSDDTATARSDGAGGTFPPVRQDGSAPSGASGGDRGGGAPSGGGREPDSDD